MIAQAQAGAQAPKRPEWLKVRVPGGRNYTEIKTIMRDLSLNTVCEEARCPNIAECWSHRTATFMILGDTCTRACGFCAVKTGRPETLDLLEPDRVGRAVAQMGLKHVVVTSVNRDDQPDGGATVFAATIRKIRQYVPDCTVEILTPDFEGVRSSLETVLRAEPTVFNHNIETVERLTKLVRRRARYRRSLEVLRVAKDIAPGLRTKSGIMVGLGETREEITQTLRDLRHRAVSAPDAATPRRGALLPSGRVRRPQARGPGAWLQARRVRPPGAQLLPCPRARHGVAQTIDLPIRTPYTIKCVMRHGGNNGCDHDEHQDGRGYTGFVQNVGASHGSDAERIDGRGTARGG